MYLDEISSVEPRSIYNILRHVSLNYYTASAVLLGSVNERTILSIETGLQKTSVLCGVSIMELVKQPDKLQLIVIPPEANNNIPLITKWTPFVNFVHLHSLDGLKGRIPVYGNITNKTTTNAIIISPKLLFSDDFVVTWNLYLKDRIGSLIVDEVQLMSNPDVQSGYMLKFLSNNIKNLYFLTATPGRDLKQFKFLCGLCNNTTPYLSITRADIGIEGEFHTSSTFFCENDIWREFRPFDEPNRLRRYRENFVEESPLTKDLLRYVSMTKRNGLSCLVYVGYLNSQTQIAEYLKKEGFTVEAINSNVSSEERKRISDSVKRREVDVVLTTVTIAIDIVTNALFLYGWCSDIVQLVGRLLRTYDKKDIFIHLSMLDFEYENAKQYILELIDLVHETDKSPKLAMSLLREVNKYV